jgi:hypothetical protein
MMGKLFCQAQSQNLKTTNMTSELSDSIQRFQQEMEHVDEVLHVLLKGHLLLEEVLTKILEQYLFHRQHLDGARLTFHQKSALGRALCLRKDHLGEWELLAVINALRNEVAHNLKLQSERRSFTFVKPLKIPR